MSETSEKKMEKQLDNILHNKKKEKVFHISDNIYSIYGSRYELIEDKGGIDTKALEERYSSILEKYDFLVGDWSYDQLRLRGFFYDKTKNVPLDMRISSLEDYLLEYCSFGCSYFVLRRLDEKTVFPEYSKSRQHNSKKSSGKGKYKKGRRNSKFKIKNKKQEEEN